MRHFFQIEVHLGGIELVGQAVGIGRNRGMELVLRALQMAVQFIALDGGVLHLASVNLAQQVRVANVRGLAHS